MSLTAFGGMPLVPVGGYSRSAYLGGAASGNITIDATAEAIIMIGQIYTEDGASHTIDTTGSSSLGWRTSTVSATWNAATILKVGLAAVDASNGPPGRAANAANVITFDVSKSYTGGAAPTTAAWNESVPDAGTKTIAHGDTVAFCVQMTNQGGTDSVLVTVATQAAAGNPSFPFVTGYTGAAYAVAPRVPNAVITFSDGTYGFFMDGTVFSVVSTNQTWNNTSGTKEYGNFFQMPFPASIYGIIAAASMGGDADFVLYSDPLGTPVSEKSFSFDLNVLGAAGVGSPSVALFTSPYSATANQPLAGIIKPTSATNVSLAYGTLNSSGHQKAYGLGANCYAINRNTGAFAAQNSNKDRFNVALLVGAFDNAASAGGLIRHPGMNGGLNA